MAFTDSLDLPMLGYSLRVSTVANIIYGVVLYAAIYSAATSTFYGFTTKIPDRSWKKYVIIIAIICGFLLGLLGFKNVVAYLYPCKVITKDIEQSHVCLGTKGITLKDDRSFAFQILNNVLGGSMSSRLFQNIREEKGLAYSVFSANGNFSSDGYFEIYAGVSHESSRTGSI